MERTVPRTDSDQIDLYIRTYYSLLRSTGEVSIEALVESHVGMDSLLHPNAQRTTPDISALIYTSLRLPSCIKVTKLVVLGQRREVFERLGYPVHNWQEVSARARRRRSYFDGQDTLALYIASRSDIDDIIPTLTAYQIEWNKIHRALSTSQSRLFVNQLEDGHMLTEEEHEILSAALGLPLDEVERLCTAWGDETVLTLKAMTDRPKRFSLRLLAGSQTDYRKATRHWWLHIEDNTPEIDYDNRPVYFVSSNTHSLVNLWSGYALRKRETLRAFIEEAGHAELLAEYRDIEARAVPSSRENFLYYALKKYLDASGADAWAERIEAEEQAGIRRASSEYGFDLDAQVIEINKIRSEWLDPRLCLDGIEALRESDALIFNIDYPLGMAAYEILTRVSENVGEIAGIYIMGKAASLNARLGDIMIPTVVHDEHSANTYLFNNSFSAADVAPYLIYGTVLDNQKAVTVRGTFLQNARYMSVFYREGYTDIEMEAGPYLSAVYELIRPKRHPYNEIVSLYPARFDIGIVHYASDTPLNKGRNLGAGSLSYRGMDPTYAAAVAILRRILSQEIAHIQGSKTQLRESRVA
ncbi:MAG TPA: hypothetical protein ENI95_12510 [Chloroflexi bacterium]|nr:hypothetical protein [Chloroflexota bacterium]